MFLVALLLSVPAVAQEVTVQVATEEPPHYVGVSAIVQLTVDGLEADPEPQCVAESSSPDVRVRLAGISPRIVQRMFQSGSQIRRIQQVTHTIQFRVTANKPGEYEIGPFVITQGGTEERVDAIKMTFAEVPTTDDMRIQLQLPESAYPDQRVPLKIQWWFAGDTDNVNQLNIDGTMLDEFQFAPDPPPQRSGSRLPIQTDAGTLTLAATAAREMVDGKEFTVVTAQRTLIPNRPGTYEIPPMTATIELVTQWDNRRRSQLGGFGFGGSLLEEAFGGRRRPAKVELFRAAGEPLTFLVKPFPREGRPESFSGAVGNGFSLDVSADRTVVRVGDPIRLTLHLRGDGNIQGATLPPLSADGGLDPQHFRLPEGDVTGVIQDDQDGKQFLVSVRVLDEGISEIPAIAYSWFDAEQEQYRTTRSKPIALRVMPAQVVGADAVVSSQPGVSPGASSSSSANPTGEPSKGTGVRSFALSGADLAIQPDPQRLLSGSTSLLAKPSFQIVNYALGSVCLIVALLDRRRRQVDPVVRQASAVVRNQRGRIAAAGKLPEKDAAKQIADALRVVQLEFPNTDRSAIQTLLAECDAIAYRPDDKPDATISTDLVDRALAAVDAMKSKAGAA
ncbi:BatD family protein [Stieleria mannarensis]|uniref:BatD family protein n=1 Tax=Stieleria mannarensis TaxID=2755585 RepID=UPI001603D9C3|nr:BatD family protein [Rhodopirellula sp. JC639]